MLQLIPAASEQTYQEIRSLLDEYIAWDSAQTRQHGLNVQALMEFQYAAGSEEIPGSYQPPIGCLLLARYNGISAGCGAFRALDPNMCELKRLYVRPTFQGQSIGKRLTIELIRLAYELGYSTMRLETTTFMTGALALYTALGFRTCAPHYEIPQIFEEITVFMELDIRRAVQ